MRYGIEDGGSEDPDASGGVYDRYMGVCNREVTIIYSSVQTKVSVRTSVRTYRYTVLSPAESASVYEKTP